MSKRILLPIRTCDKSPFPWFLRIVGKCWVASCTLMRCLSSAVFQFQLPSSFFALSGFLKCVASVFRTHFLVSGLLSVRRASDIPGRCLVVRADRRGFGAPFADPADDRETAKGRLVQNISVSDFERFVDYEKIFGKIRPIDKRRRL
jgi:hypothetical protein